MGTPTSIGHYRIIAKLGEGGMGEVWRATDTKLGRDVAIKVLPEVFANDADRMARFEREAQVLASLNHPNIAAIYGVEDRALVMELVEGEMLAGPLPVETAVQYGKQIAEALEAAHEKGIVHRDLKPANVKVKPDGTIKVLDFGLAKSAEHASGDSQNSPTMTMRATVAGMIMGTAGYMSPEQAAGKPVDKRSDIWSFGVVLCEMLTGRRLFEGETISHTLADVLRGPIDLEKLPPDTPPVIRRLIARCLERDVKKRLRDIGEARIVLESPIAEAAAAPRRRPLPWVAAAAFAVAAAIGVWSPWRPQAVEERPAHFQLNAPRGAQLVLGAGGGSAISPDGRTIAFVAVASGSPMLWVRPIDSVIARELSGTEGGQFPFWSPDSRSIGFFAGGKLKRVDLLGGSPGVIANAPAPAGGTWNQEGTIIFARISGQGLQSVSAAGGAPAPIMPIETANREGSQRWPVFLPDGRRFLYFSLARDSRRTGIHLGSLDRPNQRTFVTDSLSGAVYIPPRGTYAGYLLWSRQETMVARQFDPDGARFTGEIFPVAGGESVTLISGRYYSGISASIAGDVLFVSGNEQVQLTWRRRDGTPIGVVGQPSHWTAVRISPDGTRVALSVADASGIRDLSVIDFARGLQTRLTSGVNAIAPIWSPDSRHIAYSAVNGLALFQRSANSSGQQETILEASHSVFADDWSPDGRYFLYEEAIDGHFNLWLAPLTGPREQRKPVPYLKTASDQSNAQFSPDGKWVAYTSSEAGQEQVYVQAFPASEQKWQVSDAGGNYARWRHDGKELFYRSSDGKLMVVAVRPAGRGLEFGKPELLFPIGEPIGPHTYPYDVSPDGQRILMLRSASEENTSALTLLMNWRAGLTRK